MPGHDYRLDSHDLGAEGGNPALAPGKRTLTQFLPPSPVRAAGTVPPPVAAAPVQLARAPERDGRDGHDGRDDPFAADDPFGMHLIDAAR